MATAQAWIEGARLRTLPASAAPVLLGTGIAAGLGKMDPVSYTHLRAHETS